MYILFYRFLYAVGEKDIQKCSKIFKLPFISIKKIFRFTNGNFGCGCSWDTEEYKFTNLYHGLKEIIELHQHENYFKKELANIDQLQSNPPAIMQLLKKNENIGTEDSFLFWFEWLDKENNTVRPWIMNWNDLNIIFSREEWKHTINFLTTFNQLYWESDLCQ